MDEIEKYISELIFLQNHFSKLKSFIALFRKVN